MTPALGLLSGIDCVYDDIIARITTAFLWYSPQDSMDINQFVNAAVNDPAQLLQPVLTQINRDPRVQAATGTATFLGNKLTMNITIELITGKTFTIVGQAGTLPSTTFQFNYSITSPTGQN